MRPLETAGTPAGNRQSRCASLWPRLADFGRKPQFEVSVRLVTRVGSAPAPDTEPETTLQGEPEAILHRIDAYGEAGADRIVIEPVSSGLDDFLRQLAHFADKVTPHVTRTRA